jgi:ABC-type microcin C transport system permease subunit YejB
VEYADYLSGLDSARHPQSGHNGSQFDIWSSTLIIIGYAIPAFLFAILLIVIFAGAAIWTCFRCAGWCR